MKPMGPIPPYFEVRAGQLVLAGQPFSHWLAQVETTPAFIYDMGVVRQKVAAFRAAMPSEVSLHYAVKANPLPALIRAMVTEVDAFDVASGGELERVLAAGAAAEQISFAGPGKRDAALEAAIRAGVTINLESESEAARALSIAARLGVRPRLAVRVNPDFDIKGSGMRMGGGAKPFGVDAERVPDLVRQLVDAGADWRGFHIFAGSQALDTEALIATQQATVKLAADLATQAGVAPPSVNLGGGFGIPYFPGDTPVDVERIGAALNATLAPRPEILRDTHFHIELGRWLVGECGVYLTRILDRKISHQEVFLVVDGGLQHQLAASGNFGTVVRRNYPLAIASAMDAPGDEEVSVVGCLCTPLDRLGDKVGLPHAEPGDVVAIFLAGAYGASASPMDFLGHGPAEEMLVGV
ncbi:pyridoxal-dependent decarboxylase, exosortase A system-associated [Aquisediminimonas sediminicola]|uniref:pyridoxal-dependent decarboxylase, exosortase A system-associated n=1 Tax=Alteraquisediminimonas sediminicola TaxID=2676787 RepID=UPI001C8D11FF|nr:pyridoxal-dependent decarboxylase, exosortase A system-associated [Aquisediminimonas sediminicola]